MTEILEAPGFADVTFTDVDEPVYYGPNVASALDWVRGFTSTSNALKQLDPDHDNPASDWPTRPSSGDRRCAAAPLAASSTRIRCKFAPRLMS